MNTHPHLRPRQPSWCFLFLAKQIWLPAWPFVRALLLAALLPLGACDEFPNDPEHTLAEARNGTLRVGYSENPPWVVKTAGAPTGIEPALVQGFARALGAQVQWRNDTEQHLFEALEEKQLHLVIAGITDENPWKKKVAFTRPFVKLEKPGQKLGKAKHVMATIQGENAFIVALEKYLHQQEPALQTQLQP
jgi:hypothetical protein